MGFTEILASQGVTVKQWDADCNKRYLRQLFWNRFMSTSMNSPIQVKADLTKTKGDAMTFNIASEIVGGVVTGSAKVSGNEGVMHFAPFQVTVDNDNVSVRVENIPMTQQRAAFDTLKEARDGLARKRAQRTDERITSALSDITEGRVKGRYVYGVAPSTNWNATHATALANMDNTDDKLTTNIIDIAKEYAKIPQNATGKIRPMIVKDRDEEDGYQEWFLMAAHTYAIRDMVNLDAVWRQPMLLIPPMANKNNVLFTGSSFKGAYNAVLVHEWEGMGLETNSNSVQCSHNLLLGAQAGCIAWAQHSRFKEELDNYEEDAGYKLHEINGIKKVVYDFNAVNGESNEDYGIIHVYTAAVGR
jgi:hypothetical protein